MLGRSKKHDPDKPEIDRAVEAKLLYDRLQKSQDRVQVVERLLDKLVIQCGVLIETYNDSEPKGMSVRIAKSMSAISATLVELRKEL